MLSRGFWGLFNTFSKYSFHPFSAFIFRYDVTIFIIYILYVFPFTIIDGSCDLIECLHSAIVCCLLCVLYQVLSQLPSVVPHARFPLMYLSPNTVLVVLLSLFLLYFSSLFNMSSGFFADPRLLCFRLNHIVSSAALLKAVSRWYHIPFTSFPSSISSISNLFSLPN